MTIEFICQEVHRLKRKYGDDNPFELASDLGILLVYSPMGNNPEDCKGFYLCQSRKKTITINSDLPQSLQRIICIHEIGHAVLHAKQAGVSAFHDFSLFDGAARAEYEANMFAAEYLLDDEEVFDLLNDDLFFFTVAGTLRVPAELLDFKYRILKSKGYKMNPLLD